MCIYCINVDTRYFVMKISFSVYLVTYSGEIIGNMMFLLLFVAFVVYLVVQICMEYELLNDVSVAREIRS